MKSFKEYLNRRSMAISEMAVEKIKRGDKEITAHIKTPIQCDQDDIDFLQQFPPQFWAQALNRRYGNLLLLTHQLHEKGEKMPESFYVDLVGKGGTTLKFPVRNAKMNELYEELNGAEDSSRYSTLDPKELADEESVRKKYYSNEDGSERTRIGNKKLSKYGFDLNNFRLTQRPTNGKPFYEGEADGYVIPGMLVCRETVKQWIDHLDEGWYDDQVDGTRSVVNFGTKSHKTKRAEGQSGERELPVVSGSERTTWEVVGVTKKGKRKVQKFESAIPDIKPGFHVDVESKRKHDFLLDVSKKMKDRIRSRNFDDYIELISDEYLSNPDFSDIDVIDERKFQELSAKLSGLSNKKEAQKSEDKKRKSEMLRLSKLLEFATYLKDEKNKKEFIDLYGNLYRIAEGDSEEKQKTAIVNTIQKTLEKVVDYIKEKRIDVIKNSQRYNIHQWNAHRHNPNFGSPIRNFVQIGGVFEPHKQQPGVDYQKIRDIFDGNDEDVNVYWSHLSNEVRIQEYCKYGAAEQINRVSDASVNLYEGIYIKSLKEAMLENLDSISKNAGEQFLNKTGLYRSTINYAKYFKEKIINEKQSIESFMQDAKARQIRRSVVTSASGEGGNYAIQVFQLHKRFLERKYDRDQARRPENPWIGLSLMDVIEKFHTGDPRIQDLAPRTSHSISTLQSMKGSANDAIEDISSNIENQIKTTDLAVSTGAKQKSKASVNKDQSEKEMNTNIFVSTIEKVKKAIGSTLSSAAEKVSGAVSAGANRMKQIMQRTLMGNTTQQEPQNQPQKPQTQQEPKKPSLIQRFLGGSK